MRLQPPGPLPERRLRDELPDPRLPELRLIPSTPPALCAPEPRAPGPAASRGDTCALEQTHVQRIGLTSLPRLYRAARVCEQRCSGGGRPTVQEQVSRPFWNDPLSSPSYTRTPASGGAAQSQVDTWLARALSVLHHHNSNSTLSIKVSKLAQILPPTHGPELQCA